MGVMFTALVSNEESVIYSSVHKLSYENCIFFNNIIQMQLHHKAVRGEYNVSIGKGLPCNLKWTGQSLNIRTRTNRTALQILCNVWHVLMAPENMFLYTSLTICNIWTVRALHIRLFATLCSDMSLQVWFPCVHLSTIRTIITQSMGLWYTKRMQLLFSQIGFPADFWQSFLESLARTRIRWNLINSAVCKNRKLWMCEER